MATDFKFGDVIEWDIPTGIIRWFVICRRKDQKGYRAIWMSGGSPRAEYIDHRVADIMGAPREDSLYRVVSNE